jgi:SAM-dependent methyltransferase
VKAADRKAHWERVYAAKAETEVSWFQADPAPSLEALARVGAERSAAIIDVGGGASRLVDRLVEQGFEDVTVLDLSAAALEAAKARLGEAAGKVRWIVADATEWTPARTFDVWHDRAAFHFLVDPDDQASYVERLRRALRPGGFAIIATFALDGPEKCSGLPVARRDAESLCAALGPGFVLVETRRCDHRTPSGAIQHFQFSAFRRV